MTYHRRWIAAIVLALGGLFLCFLGGGISQAGAPAGGKGPGDALALPDGWQTVEAGQQTWYAFRYGGDKSDILVLLSASPAGSAAFAVWSPTDVERWTHGGGAEPTGRGSSNAVYGGDLVWAGNSSSPGAWYIVVEPSGSAQTWFNLQVSGSGVTRSAEARQSSSPAAQAMPSASAVRAASTPTPGAPTATPVPAQQSAADPYGLAYFHPRTPTPVPPAQYPNDALSLPEGPQTLNRGQHIWYAFYYDGDRSRITMQLHADPPGSATFTVWSWDVLQRWWEGYFYTPTGRGTPNEANGGDLIWTGGSIIRGQWYVVVEQSGQSASTYTLQVTGSGIGRWLKPTPVPTPAYSLPLPTHAVYR